MQGGGEKRVTTLFVLGPEKDTPAKFRHPVKTKLKDPTSPPLGKERVMGGVVSDCRQDDKTICKRTGRGKSVGIPKGTLGTSTR